MEREYPKTRRDAVVERIHGVEIEDPYRWLEDSTCKEVMDWIGQQNELTLSIIEEYPGYDSMKKRMSDLYNHDQVYITDFTVTNTGTGPRFFYLFRGAGENQAKLCYQDGERGDRNVLYDPITVSKEGLASVDWFSPSNDGSRIAFGVSEGGTEKSVLRVMVVGTKSFLEEKIPQTKWCSLKWLHNEGFYYSRYPLPGSVSDEDLNYYHHVYYHRLGEDYEEDVKVFGETREKTEHPHVLINAECSLLAIASHRFTSTDIHIAEVNPDNPATLDFVPLIETHSFLNAPLFDGNNLYVLTQRDAPNGQIVRYDLSAFLAHKTVPEASTIIPESEGVIFYPYGTRFTVLEDKVAVIEDRNVSSSLKLYDTDSKELVDETHFRTHVTIYTLASAPGLDTFYYLISSFFSPICINGYEPGGVRTVFKPRVDIDSTQFQSEQVWYISKDGTKIPMFLLSKKNIDRNESTPVTVTGYGGFGISIRPQYAPAAFAWIALGGVVALPNLRGGGEYGREWHRAGNRENKQNVFDDFIAATEWLIEKGIGSRDTISITGGSNGGLLVGAALVQRPDLFGAVTCRAPLLDMIRYTNFQVAKTWVSEYGNPEIEEEFNWIYPYSPYHHVRDVSYPPTLLLTALGDTRVDPMHALKMAARLQYNVGPLDEERPILLYTESKAGHGAGISKEKAIDISAKSFTFRAHHTGMDLLRE